MDYVSRRLGFTICFSALILIVLPGIQSLLEYVCIYMASTGLAIVFFEKPEKK